MPAPLVTTNGHDQPNPVTIMDRTSSQEGDSSAAQFNSDSDEQGYHSVDAAKEDEANEVVGVSIGPTQSRLKARLTPATEKSRIMERHGPYFDHEAIPNGTEPGADADALFLPEITSEPESLHEPEPAAVAVAGQRPEPAALRQNGAQAHPDSAAAPKDGQRTSFTRLILKNGLPRPRAWSGDAISNLKLKKFLPDLTALTKRSALPFRSNSSHSRIGSQPGKTPESPAGLAPGGLTPGGPSNGMQQRRRSFSTPDPEPSLMEEPVPELKPLSGASAARHSYTRRPSTVSARPGSLKRSSSDQSLYLRASSTASSLDQRPQYEHIHSQVNSRFKAIKDSLQDSSSRLLSMPSLHLQDLRSEWGYRPFLSDAANRRGNQDPDERHSHREILKEKKIPHHPRDQSPRNNTSSTSAHPVLDEAIEELTGDVVILGGYRGSILRSAKPPHRQLWVPMKVGLNIRKVDLEVGLDPEDEERMEETIIPSGVLSHVGPVDICRRLLKRLQKSDNAVTGKLRVWNYGYDWRLSPHLLSKKLIQFLEGLPSNDVNKNSDLPPTQRGAYVIAHSLGGLITRHAVNQRPELFAGVLYAGVPQHCVNILGPLRHGDEVLLSSRVLTAQVNFTFRTSFALLPEDGHCFIDKRTKEEYRVDFFDARSWDEYRLSPCINPPLPPLNPSTRAGALKDNISKRFSTVLGNGRDSFSADDPSQPPPTDLPPSRRSTDIPVSSTPNHPHHHHHNHHRQNTTPIPVPEPPTTTTNLIGPPSTPHPRLATTCTLPRAAALTYLTRTLAEIKHFKHDLAFRPALQDQNRYPPAAVLYGKSVPTLYGARVVSRAQIKHLDAYDDLAFAAGDGVCLASAAMLPTGYRVIRGGLVKSDRGHVGLLGDLEGVGVCLRALVRGRAEGVGCGLSEN